MYIYFQPGCYIQVHIVRVNRGAFEAFAMIEDKPLIVVGLLPYEQKMSLLNIVLKHSSMSTRPIKSKERLIFQCGFRRFAACPIFSQHTNGAKHKVSVLSHCICIVAISWANLHFIHEKFVLFSTRDTFTPTILSWRACMHRLLFHRVQSCVTSRVEVASSYVYIVLDFFM